MSRIGENIRHYIFRYDRYPPFHFQKKDKNYARIKIFNIVSHRLAEERDNTFAKSIEHFIQCTKESTETKPSIVMRNVSARTLLEIIHFYFFKLISFEI